MSLLSALPSPEFSRRSSLPDGCGPFRHAGVVRLHVGLVSVIFALVAAACSESTEPPVTTTVTVTPSSATLTTEGGTVDLSAAARDQNGDPMPGATFTWSSDASSVASVDAEGVVTAESNGSAQVSATTDGVSGSASITVDFPVLTTVEVAPDSALLVEVGETVALAATATDQDGESMSGFEFAWTTSDADVASVDGSGTVTAEGDGIATVTATTDGVSGEATLLVASSLAYVSHRFTNAETGTNPVYVLKVATGEVLDSVEVGALAGEMAIHPAGNRVYVVENPQQPGEASIIATASNTVTGSVTVGTTPIYAAISPDGSHVYVGNVGAQTISVIETTTDTEVTAVDVNGLPRGLAVTPDGGSVYVTLGDDCPGTVEVIDTDTNAVIGSIALAECAGGDIAINPVGAFAYVPDGRFTSVTVIDTGDNTVETTIEGLFAPRDVAINADGSLAYVTEFTTGGDLVVVDATSHEIMDEIDLGSTRTPSTVALSPDGIFAYVTSPDTNEILVVSTLTNKLVDSVPVGSNPFHVAIAPS